MNQGTFTSKEWALALSGAFVLEVLFVLLLALFGNSRGESKQIALEQPMEVPIEVQPVLDELPLLKLGSKKAIKPRLPDMWKKREPVPVKRLEERSAPSEEAKDDPEEIPKSEFADKDHEAPDEDDEIVKESDQKLEDEDLEDAPEYNEEGAEDGFEEGTETDPLKARQADLYKMRIAAWLNQNFTQPSGIPCDELKRLSAAVTISVGGGRTVANISVAAPSGNGIFDSKVRGDMSRLVGQQVPPPPPAYPELLNSTLSARVVGRAENCAHVPSPSPSPDPSPTAPEPSEDREEPDAPAPDPEPEASPEPGPSPNEDAPSDL